MGTPGDHDLTALETGIKTLSASLTALGDTSDLEDLILRIHGPGWTTPAEALLVNGVIAVLQEHAQAITTLRQVLTDGSKAVGAGGSETTGPAAAPSDSTTCDEVNASIDDTTQQIETLQETLEAHDLPSKFRPIIEAQLRREQQALLQLEQQKQALGCS